MRSLLLLSHDELWMECLHSALSAGREYDKDGVLKPWWAQDVIVRFNETAQCFVQQYNAYTSNGEHVSIRSFLSFSFMLSAHMEQK